MTSDKPIQDNPAPNATNKATKQAKDAKIKVQTATTSVQSDSQKSPSHCEVTCKTEKNWWDSIKPWVEMAGILLLMVYTGYTIKQVWVAERSSRPFVGIDSFSVIHQKLNSQGQAPTMNPSYFPDATSMRYQVSIKNFGPLPALSFKADGAGYLDNIEQRTQGVGQQPSTLNPTQVVHMHGVINGSDYRNVMDGNKVMTLKITLSYEGPEAHYSECTVNRYDPIENLFLTTGSCTQ